jgi:hypothetical protein
LKVKRSEERGELPEFIDLKENATPTNFAVKSRIAGRDAIA